MLVSNDVREHVAAVQQHHEPALVEARMTLEPVEPRQRVVVDLVELAWNARAPTATQSRKAAEVVQRVRRGGERRAAQTCSREEPVIRLAAEQGAVHEDRRHSCPSTAASASGAV